MTIDSDVLFLGLAKAIKVKYRAIEGNFGHGRRLSAAHKSKFDLLRRPATTAVASVKFEIKSLNIKEW
ncbi:hypothetical protein H9P43_006948 [Blastocladiella emersonii ATCC 22665]|nr:hypothetical protein H9P43_006948 [Blastocladiella emersonii ATCC 22665]